MPQEPITITRELNCPECSGSGIKSKRTCANCGGSGKVTMTFTKYV